MPNGTNIRAQRRPFEPAYAQAWKTKELQSRALMALDRLHHCGMCPRACGVNRWKTSAGFCGIGRYARVETAFPHHGEEACLRGTCGSGTIFFGSCNLRCVFCQNFEISWRADAPEYDAQELAAIMLRLQKLGCHNINLVTPSHVIPQILEALLIAVAHGLHLPLVYNSGGFDSVDSLRLLDGIVDIYMPDFKFWRPAVALRFANAPNYPEVARQAISEMNRQVGPLIIGDDGVAQRGLLLRHLVMPAGTADTGAIMQWVADTLGPDTYVNVMQQYRPSGLIFAREFCDVDRRTTGEEYREALDATRGAGIRRVHFRSIASEHRDMRNR